MDEIITRFPPSPTGYLHVGGARTALFNWLYARHMKGRFILRLEDTDMKRSKKEYSDAIIDSLHWMGLDWDEGPYFQSERFDLYKEYIQKLIDSGNAYYCTCSPERLETIRSEAMAEGRKPKYDGACRNRDLGKTSNAVVRLVVPQAGTTTLKDAVKGNIEFQNSELDDFIICRSDGTPTYHLAVVVDDITMGVNTIIRGDDHVNNTPKQMLLYRAFKNKIPLYGHVPMVLGRDRTRLSKRHGALSVTAYKEMGYLPDALINYLVRLGWSHGDQEFFLKDELIEKFTLKNIGHSPGIFDTNKLLSLNADHIKGKKPGDLVKHLTPFLEKRRCKVNDQASMEKIIETLNTRSKTLEDMADGAMFYFAGDLVYDAKAAKKFLKRSSMEPLKLLLENLGAMDSFTKEGIEDAFKKVMETTGLKLGKIAQPVRVALTGKTASPGIFEILEVLGKDKSVYRLEKAINHINETADIPENGN